MEVKTQSSISPCHVKKIKLFAFAEMFGRKSQSINQSIYLPSMYLIQVNIPPDLEIVRSTNV
jgi:hypothetical protein